MGQPGGQGPGDFEVNSEFDQEGCQGAPSERREEEPHVGLQPSVSVNLRAVRGGPPGQRPDGLKFLWARWCPPRSVVLCVLREHFNVLGEALDWGVLEKLWEAVKVWPVPACKAVKHEQGEVRGHQLVEDSTRDRAQQQGGS